MEKLKVGIAGYGVVGKRRRTFIDANPHLSTVAVSDVSFSGDGLLPDGVACFDNFGKLFQHDLDVLFVSLPNYLTAKVTIAGLEKGLHVFCEKPPGRNVQDIRDVIKVESEIRELKLKYGFNHRYHASVAEAKEIIGLGNMERLSIFAVFTEKAALSLLMSAGARKENLQVAAFFSTREFTCWT